MKLSHILAVILVLVICVFIYVVAFGGSIPQLGSVSSSNPTSQFNTAGALYSQSVDLANAGKYKESLQAADQALAQNAVALNPIIQANRAGILVMLGRNEDAITAADAALGAQGNLTTVYSIAYFNKGNALRNLGRTDEAKAAYAKAAGLDPTLVNPYQTTSTISPKATAK